jgi:hypothetical protein
MLHFCRGVRWGLRSSAPVPGRSNPQSPEAYEVFHSDLHSTVLRVADPRSGARLCEAQQPTKSGSSQAIPHR